MKIYLILAFGLSLLHVVLLVEYARDEIGTSGELIGCLILITSGLRVLSGLFYIRFIIGCKMIQEFDKLIKFGLPLLVLELVIGFANIFITILRLPLLYDSLSPLGWMVMIQSHIIFGAIGLMVVMEFVYLIKQCCLAILPKKIIKGKWRYFRSTPKTFSLEVDVVEHMPPVSVFITPPPNVRTLVRQTI